MAAALVLAISAGWVAWQRWTSDRFVTGVGEQRTVPLADGSIGTVFAGPGVDDTVFTIPAAGSYFFRCDIHPTTMTGTFTVR